jgi:hypothetical protein
MSLVMPLYLLRFRPGELAAIGDDYTKPKGRLNDPPWWPSC